jgi:ATP:ADP antiporter, AAA family
MSPEPASPASPSFLDRALQIVAPVKRGEAASALLLLVNVFVLLTCYYVLKVLREPLILLGGGATLFGKKFDGAELKAYTTAGQSVLLLFVVPAFGYLASRVNRIRLLTIVQIIFVVSLVVFALLAQANATIGIPFYLWLGIFNMMVVSNFWAFANDLYTPEQGKRLFPMIGLGGSIGAIVGAQIPSWLEGTDIMLLFLFAAAGLVISTVLYRLVDARERHDRDPAGLISLLKPEAKHPVGREGGFRLVLGDRYLRLMALMVVIFTVTNSTGEYVVGKLVKDASLTAANPRAFISAFYSDFYSAVNIASALLQGLVVSRVLGKVGIRRALWIMPLIVVLGWTGFLAVSTLVMIRMTKIAENSVDYSLHNTLRQALYLPTSRESKYKAKAAIDTFFVRIGDVVAGIGLVYLVVEVLKLDVSAFAWINTALAVVWLLLVVRIGKLHDQRTEERAARAAAGLRETML